MNETKESILSIYIRKQTRQATGVFVVLSLERRVLTFIYKNVIINIVLNQPGRKIMRVCNPIERLALQDAKRERNLKVLKLLVSLPVIYVGLCLFISLLVLVSAALGAPSLGEYVPYIHWPLKLLVPFLL
ncbi:MAG: hypothetical protein WD509_00670 [Candidatus Paceibacterota bacterium]